MEPSGDRDYQDRRVGPTVSKEKWINHARVKMSRGYVLVVGKNKKSANFYMRSKGFEMCPFNVAKQLIKDGIVVEAGEHHLGTMYKLADDVTVHEPPRRKQVVVEEPADDVEILIDIPEETDADADDADEKDDAEGLDDEDDDADDLDDDDDLA